MNTPFTSPNYVMVQKPLKFSIMSLACALLESGDDISTEEMFEDNSGYGFTVEVRTHSNGGYVLIARYPNLDRMIVIVSQYENILHAVEQVNGSSEDAYFPEWLKSEINC